MWIEVPQKPKSYEIAFNIFLLWPRGAFLFFGAFTHSLARPCSFVAVRAWGGLFLLSPQGFFFAERTWGGGGGGGGGGSFFCCCRVYFVLFLLSFYDGPKYFGEPTRDHNFDN